MIRPFDFSWLPQLPMQARQWFQELYDQLKSVFGTIATCFGPGQTWQNMAGSRAFGTTYTNTTGRPIWVKASAYDADADYLTMYEYVNGANIGVSLFFTNGGAGNYHACVDFIVPPGSTYMVQPAVNRGSYAIALWWELR